MGFTSFVGRVFFASVFLLSAYQALTISVNIPKILYLRGPFTSEGWEITKRFNEYAVDGGPAAKTLRPKYGLFTSHMHSHAGIQVPEIEIKYLVVATIVLKGIGGILFIVGSSLEHIS